MICFGSLTAIFPILYVTFNESSVGANGNKRASEQDKQTRTRPNSPSLVPSHGQNCQLSREICISLASMLNGRILKTIKTFCDGYFLH